MALGQLGVCKSCPFPLHLGVEMGSGVGERQTDRQIKVREREQERLTEAGIGD